MNEPKVTDQITSDQILELKIHLDAAYQSLLFAKRLAITLNLNRSNDEIYHALNYIEGANPKD